MSSSAGDLASELAGLIESLPAGVSPFTFLRQKLDSQVYTTPTGYWRIHDFLFIALHALIMLFSIAGCITRKLKGNFRFFSYRNKKHIPNTAVTTQVMFTCYSIFYIVSVVTNDLLRPTSTAYGFYVPATLVSASRFTPKLSQQSTPDLPPYLSPPLTSSEVGLDGFAASGPAP
ncbi:hypothetical protein RQP46_010486 [Phenoliferia psychrophenolica]